MLRLFIEIDEWRGAKNENVKVFFCTYIRENYIDLHHAKIEMILTPFYTYSRIHFTS